LPEICTLDQKTPDFQRRFGGLSRLFGPAGASRVFSAHVVVVGLGGVGSWSAEALARSGVGSITLIDMDHVSESNINRQIHATSCTLGQSKIEAMQERIKSINPLANIYLIDDFVTPENWFELVARLEAIAPIDGLIDACDQVFAKTAMAAWLLKQPRLKKPIYVTVGAAGGKQNAHDVELADLASTTHDPLLAKMRYNLRRNYGASREGRMGISCVFSQESVIAQGLVSPDANLNCHGYGSSVGVTATFGMCAASYVLKKLAKDM
jgi:tRNA A37 threonylcarbamoyladenosine dehydratase